MPRLLWPTVGAVSRSAVHLHAPSRRRGRAAAGEARPPRTPLLRGGRPAWKQGRGRSAPSSRRAPASGQNHLLDAAAQHGARHCPRVDRAEILGGRCRKRTSSWFVRDSPVGTKATTSSSSAPPAPIPSCFLALGALPASRTEDTEERASGSQISSRAFESGASRTRTGDLLGAIQALSQLSYSPAARSW